MRRLPNVSTPNPDRRLRRLQSLYGEAGDIAVAAMGEKNANEDPLAYWCLVDWIVMAAKRYRDARTEELWR